MIQLEQISQQIAKMQCPYKVDVVDSVMERINTGRGNLQKKSVLAWRAASVAAVFLLAIGVWTSVNIQKQRNMSTQLATALTYVNDYSNYYDDFAIEEMADQSLETFFIQH